jgi:hypothetical protein
MDQKKSIIICGYPKSGTTWLSRLVADMVDCPLLGNWGFVGQQSQYVEGTERVSAFNCYKSHHQWAQLQDTLRKGDCRLLYIVRDPRDVAISARHHFTLSYPRLRRGLSLLPGGRLIYAQILSAVRRLTRKQDTNRKLVNAVIYGDQSISGWLAVSWRDHYIPFRNAGVLMTRYEDLLEQPLPTCRRILNYLGVHKSDADIQQSIENQSFDNRKKSVPSPNRYKYRVLRRGGSGYWQAELSNDEKDLFTTVCASELRELSY